MQNQQNGSRLLFVTSIGMIIFFSIVIATLLFTVLCNSFFMVTLILGFAGGAFLAALVCAGFQIAVGIAGIANWKKPQKAVTCFVLGIISVVLGAIFCLATVVVGKFTFSSLIGLTLPIVYLVGANQLKSMA